ncbi:MAG: hypothetical protein LBL52_03650 [Rickettsiales bacterium]|jgi:hypothetical protein|nr:hypothetical protein [Rickettsiales bacterium]
MYRQSITLASFARGEISPDLYGRGDFSAYRAGAMRIRNMRPMGTGGIARRDGLVFMAELGQPGVLVPFESNNGKRFIFFLSAGKLCIYNEKGAACDLYDDARNEVKSITTPYNADAVSALRHAQKGDDVYLATATAKPKIIRYNPYTDIFTMLDWEFAKKSGADRLLCPFAKFPIVERVLLTPSGTTGNITITASETIFRGGHVGVRFNLNGGQVEITWISATMTYAEATVRAALSSTAATKDWTEQAFSVARGWPSSLTFHQGRLVIGGSRDLPNRMWMSKTGEYNNFDLGEGLDDEAIEFDILSDRGHLICSVFSGKHLQVFTTDSEWMVSGFPLTPSSLAIKEQTRIGSIFAKNLAPQLVEGSTVFVAKNEREIREFYYGEIEGGYFSDDLASLSSHLLNAPIDQDYDRVGRTLYIVQGDGTIAALLINKAMETSAWFAYETDGKFLSLCAIGGSVWVAVERFGQYFLERFSKDAVCDSCVVRDLAVPTAEVSGLGHLEGKTVCANADGYVFEAIVSGGKIQLPIPARRICVGMKFAHLLCPLPPFIGRSRPPKASRLLDLAIRVENTPLLQADVGEGLKSYTGQQLDTTEILDRSLGDFTGDIHIRARGFVRNFESALYKISGDKPFKLKILNITATIECVK